MCIRDRTERDDTDKVWAALNDPSKHVVVQPAPSIRATLGECFGMPLGTNVEGKMEMCIRDSHKVAVRVFFVLEVAQHADDVLDAVRGEIALRCV